MLLPGLEGKLKRLIRVSAEGHGLLWVCLALSFGGTVFAAYPVTGVVVPAALLAPRRWPQITAVMALGSAVGGTLLVFIFHHLGWAHLYERFPEVAADATWHQVMEWVARYGAPALFVIAASPVPQTPAFVFFGISRHAYLGVFFAMLAGKAIKYGLFAWLASRFPERFRNGIGSRWHS